MDNLLRYLIKWNQEMQKRGIDRWFEKNIFNKAKEVPDGVFYGTYMPVESTPDGKTDMKVTVCWR